MLCPNSGQPVFSKLPPHTQRSTDAPVGAWPCPKCGQRVALDGFWKFVQHAVAAQQSTNGGK